MSYYKSTNKYTSKSIFFNNGIDCFLNEYVGVPNCPKVKADISLTYGIGSATRFCNFLKVHSSPLICNSLAAADLTM